MSEQWEKEKNSLKMYCPLCGKEGGCEQKKTKQLQYIDLNEKLKELFKIITPRGDISYRERSRKCYWCQDTFETYEIWDKFIEGLIQEVYRLEQENKDLKSENNTYFKQLKYAFTKLSDIASIVNDEPTITSRLKGL